MKSLIIYYSRTGYTKKVGDEIAKQLKADKEEIFEIQDRSGVLGYLAAGRHAMKKELTALKPYKKNVKNYDLLIIGTPIWAWTVTPAIRTYLSQNKAGIKKVAFFATQGGSGAEKAFEDMQKECGKKPVATFILTTKEVVSGDYPEKVKKFVKELAKKAK